jgi:predicted site-specific integrase-resolvase
LTIKISGQRYYRTAEACETAGISKNTFLRWVREGIYIDVIHCDRRGWRLFTDEDLQRLVDEGNKTS